MPGIALIDLRHRIIPNRLTYPALVLFAVVVVLALGDRRRRGSRASAAIGLLLYGGILFVVAVVSRGMGMGDVKLAALIGLVLGVARPALRGGGGGGGDRPRRARGEWSRSRWARGARARSRSVPTSRRGRWSRACWGEPIASWYIGRFL